MSHECRACGDNFTPSAAALKKSNYTCRSCRKIEDKERRKRMKLLGISISGTKMSKDYYKRHNKEYIKRPEVRKARLAGFYRRMKDPINLYKAKARIMAWSAIKGGKLTRLPCEQCGEVKVDAHHDDYDKPLEVRWLCRKHHAILHNEEKAEARGEK